MRLIGLTGYAGSGKDTAALALTDRGWVRASFAAKVYEAALAFNPLVEIEYNDKLNVFFVDENPLPVRYFPLDEVVRAVGWDRAKREVPHVRQILQRMGDEVGRDVLDPDIWVTIAMRSLPDVDYVVFTDVRYDNEAHAIRSEGGVIIQIRRPGVGPVNNHPSERLPTADYDVVNDSDIALLHMRLLRKVRGRV